ncbi:hypothetical protein BGX29_008151 [Mortierella sp. GBA35]|nr:hypothetical protein BGX29_008151 [Mortierella sp. GBA35]
MVLRRIPHPATTTASTTSVYKRPFHASTKTKSMYSEAPPSASKPSALESKAASIGKSPVIKPLARRPRNAPRNTKWTPDLDEIILDLRRGHRTWEAISQATGRSTSACSDRFYTALDPALKSWTPAMLTKLNQMVEDGVKWTEIANALEAKIVACQHQWRTLGNGKYRIKGIMTISQSLTWRPQEIDSFWAAWIRLGEEAEGLPPTASKREWKAFAAEVRTKTAQECRIALRLDAPGWVKLETASYVQETIKAARSRKRLELKQKKLMNAGSAAGDAGEGEGDLDMDDEDLEDDDESEDEQHGERRQGMAAWTDDEHKALFEAVERHGLFSGWSKIRAEVKPYLRDDEVEAEYYHMSGVMTKPDPLSEEELNAPVEIVPVDKSLKVHGEWTEEEISRLSLVLMKYSNLPIWTRKAKEMGVTPTEEDYDILFRINRESNTTKRLSKKELKALEALEEKEGGRKRKGRGRGKKFIGAQDDATSATMDTDSATATDTDTTATTAAVAAAAAPTTITTIHKEYTKDVVIEKGSGLMWNADRTLRLRRLVGQQQLQERTGHAIDWSWIAEHIGPGFDASDCITKWQTLPEHSSIKVEPARHWDEDDIKQLEQGILTYGNSWTLIQKQFLPGRTTDSIRRKVSNLQKKREHLIQDARSTAMALKEKYPDLDVEETVKSAIEADSGSALWDRLDSLLKQYRDEHGVKRRGPGRKRTDVPVGSYL